MRRVGSGLVIWAIVACLVAVAADRAAAGWTEPIDLVDPPPGEPSGEAPRVAVDDAGRATAVWRRGPFVERARIAADGTAEAPRVIGLTNGGIAGPEVDVNGAGQVAAAFRHPVAGVGQFRVSVVRFGPGQPDHNSTTAATGLLRGTPRVAVDPQGVATAVWLGDCNIVGGDCRVKARRFATGGAALGEELTLSGTRAATPDVAVDDSGQATVVWSRGRSSATLDTIEGRRITPAGGLGSTLTLLENQEEATDPRVAVDPAGQTTIAFRAVGQNDDFVEVCRITVGGAVDCNIGEAVEGSEPSVAVDDAGRSTIVWRAGSPPSATIEAVRVPPVGGFTVGDVITVSAQQGQAVDAARLAANEAGEVIFTWLGPIQGQPPAPTLGLSRRLAPGAAGPGGILLIPTVSGAPVDVALDPGGQATAVWAQNVGGGRAVVRASQDVVVPPTCVDRTVATGFERTVAVPLSCSGRMFPAGLAQVSPPANGSVGAIDQIQSRVVYTPRRGFTGTDTFSYRGAGPGGRSTPARVTVTVRPPSVGPRPPREAGFEFGKLKRNKKRGTAKLTVRVSRAGDVELASTKQLKGVGRRAEAAGDVVLPIKPRGKAKRKLRTQGRAKAAARVTFAPSDGEPSTKSKRVKLVRR